MKKHVLLSIDYQIGCICQEKNAFIFFVSECPYQSEFFMLISIC